MELSDSGHEKLPGDGHEICPTRFRLPDRVPRLRPLLGAVGRFSTANRTPGGASTAGRGQADGIVSGRSHGRLRAVSRVRCQTAPSAKTSPGPQLISADTPPAGPS